MLVRCKHAHAHTGSPEQLATAQKFVADGGCLEYVEGTCGCMCVCVCVCACLLACSRTHCDVRAHARPHNNTGTNLARSSGDPCLLNKLSKVDDVTCPYRIEGVSGGTVLFDEAVTGVPRARDGRTNVNLLPSIYVCISLCVLHT